MAFQSEVVKIDQFLSRRRMHEAQRDTQGDKIIRDFTKMIDQSGRHRDEFPTNPPRR